MWEMMSLPMSADGLSEYGDPAGLREELHALGLQGVEAVWAMEPIPERFLQGLAVGYHLTFFTDWLDLYREDRGALTEKFGSLDRARDFYGGLGPDYLIQFYREDLERARALGARYTVFHMSDVSIEEGYTYRWRHTREEVIDAAAQVVNALLPAQDAEFDFLMENQWWPGFTMTDPALTERMLDVVKYPRKGIMLDTGHLMNTNPDLVTEQDGVAYIHRMLDAHGGLCQYIRGLHLHQSLSGAYVREHTGAVPAELPKDCVEQFGFCYGHILQIDRHQPWTIPEAASIVERIQPDYLTHELAAGTAAERRRAISAQRRALRLGR